MKKITQKGLLLEEVVMELGIRGNASSVPLPLDIPIYYGKEIQELKYDQAKAMLLEALSKALDVMDSATTGNEKFHYKVSVEIFGREQPGYCVPSDLRIMVFRRQFKLAILQQLKPHHAQVAKKLEQVMRKVNLTLRD